MTASDVDHKIVFNQDGAPKPSAKTIHGTHQRRNPLSPRHNRSRSAPEELDTSLLTGVGLTRTRGATADESAGRLQWKFESHVKCGHTAVRRSLHRLVRPM